MSMDNDEVLNEIKSLLSLSDIVQDETLNSIIKLIKFRLALKIGFDEVSKVPITLNYIVIEASISRFNRINDEGKKSASENEVSSTWETDDLAPFATDIADWVAKNNSDESKKVARFI